MEDALHERIVGQEEAIRVLARSVRRARAGLKDPRRPIGSFIFLGPTGVGKTELCKALAEFMFGSDEALLQFDMSEFMERHTVSRLVGAPPGYVGYEEAGQLTEAIRRRPYSVVCFDEIEKAHPEAFNMLLQIMEDGHLTDAKGRKVDFRNTHHHHDVQRRQRDDHARGGPRLCDAAGRGRPGRGVSGDEEQADEGAQAALPARVPEPRGRGRGLSRADARGYREDRGDPAWQTLTERLVEHHITRRVHGCGRERLVNEGL